MQLFHLFFAALTLPLITAYPSRSNHLDRRVIVPTPDKKITSYDSYMQVLMGIKWNMCYRIDSLIPIQDCQTFEIVNRRSAGTDMTEMLAANSKTRVMRPTDDKGNNQKDEDRNFALRFDTQNIYLDNITPFKYDEGNRLLSLYSAKDRPGGLSVAQNFILSADHCEEANQEALHQFMEQSAINLGVDMSSYIKTDTKCE
ncbi:hypothetical protein AWENTII_011393 [Aspergillus wentii]|nr:hypothetical protein MW887_003860 [Aspergillus wentii]